MKKILLAVMAVAAIGFTSCGNKTQQADAETAAVDSVAIVDSIAQGAAQETIDALSADLEANDVSKLQATLESIKVKIAEIVKNNPEVAKEYVVKVQTFLKENADKVKALVGDNAAVAAALSAVTDIEPASVVNGLLEQVGDAATEAKDAAVDAANQKVEEAKQAAADKANEAKEAAKEKANEAIDNAAASAKSKLGL
ncbi:MAG: hypothetical protein IIT76_00735 [Prevotella sp.]|jgi:hypothetical protein|nr:hypothetical protein [Prevotella sp.]